MNYEVSTKARLQDEKEELQRKLDDISRSQRDKEGQFDMQGDEL